MGSDVTRDLTLRLLGEKQVHESIGATQTTGCKASYLLFSQRKCGILLLETKMAVLMKLALL